MSDKTKHPKTLTLEPAEASALRLALLEKENAVLRYRLIQAESEKLKNAEETAGKTIDLLVQTYNKKYGVDLSKDKIDLTTGVITKAAKQEPEVIKAPKPEPEAKPARQEPEDEEDSDDDDDEDGEG